MAELRFNPQTRDWVMIASHRQARPQMPADWCPFCPGSGKVPDHYDVFCYDNDFPALSQNPPPPDPVANDFFRTAPAHGKCDVILYSPDHTGLITDLSDAHIGKLTQLWKQRFEVLSRDEAIKYVYIFENRGEAVGVTMPHPHGQIYGYPFIPKKIELELDSARGYRQEHGRCLYCDMLLEELRYEERVLFRTDAFTVFLPFYTEYPYGIQITANRHVQNIAELSASELQDLGLTIRASVGMLDSLFDFPLPYMMCMHNAPVNSAYDTYHFHIEFFPPMRSADKIKYNASSETGAWAHCNPTCPEEKAQELRAALSRYQTQRKPG